MITNNTENNSNKAHLDCQDDEKVTSSTTTTFSPPSSPLSLLACVNSNLDLTDVSDEIVDKIFMSLIMYIAPTMTIHYHDWVSVGFVIVKYMGERGRPLWHSFSAFACNTYSFEMVEEKFYSIYNQYMAQSIEGIIGHEERDLETLTRDLTESEQLCYKSIFAGIILR